MGDIPTENASERPGASEETAKLELPKLSLPRFGRRRKNRDATPAAVDDSAPVTDTVADTPPDTPSDTASDTAPDTTEQSGAVLVTEQAPEPLRVLEPAPEPPPADLYHEPEVATPEPVLDELPPGDPDELEPEAEREPFRLPPLPGRLAAAITGLVVGAFGAMLTYLSLQGCNALRGTETCGGTGLLLLVVILVVMVLFGAVLLAAWQITDPRSTSFLAVGVLSVVVMLTLMQQLFSPWMFLIVPVISAGSYVLSHWVTTAFIEPKPEDGPEHDVR